MAQAAEARKRGRLGNRRRTRTPCCKPTTTMLLIRRFEEKAGQLYGMGLIGGFCHLYIGQEAVVVGMQMRYRTAMSHHLLPRPRHMLATGMDPRGVMSELTGRSGGYSHGKGAHAHVQQGKNFFGGHGIVGAQVSIGTAWASATGTAATTVYR